MDDRLQILESRCEELDRSIKRLDIRISDIEKLLPPNPSTHNLTRREQLQQLCDSLRKERDGFRQERHYVGMKLTRSVRRREKEGLGTETCSTFWVRRIASAPNSAEEILRKGARKLSCGRRSLGEDPLQNSPPKVLKEKPSVTPTQQPSTPPTQPAPVSSRTKTPQLSSPLSRIPKSTRSTPSSKSPHTIQNTPGILKNRVRELIAATDNSRPAPLNTFTPPAYISHVRQYKPASRIQHF